MSNRVSIYRVFSGLAIFLLALALSLGFPLKAAAAVVGAIPGQFSVTPAGAATYSIPFNLPRGVNGLTPRLGLAYSSGGSNGLVGYGWSLSGFSIIARCGKTLVEDGKATPVTFTDEDRFCLDGNKLRLKGGTYGANDATYRTELERFFLITSHTSGGTGDVPQTGPQWFEVKTPSGLVYEYGKTVDARIFSSGQDAVRIWALSKIKDKNGNFILFKYSNDSASHAYRPSEVSYTGNGGSLDPAHTIVFGYESLPSGVDPIIRYVAGTRIEQTQRLATVTINYLGSRVHSYALSYETSSPTRRSRLIRVTECGPDDCLPATEIDWQDGASGFGATVGAGSSYAASYVHVMDVNGDGRTDLVYPRAGSYWYIMFGTSSGLGSPQSTGITSYGYEDALVLRYNGDNRADLILPNSSGYWRVLKGGAANGFVVEDTGLTATGHADGDYDVVDVDGDGLDDLIYKRADRKLYQRLNTGGGFGGQTLRNSDVSFELSSPENGIDIPRQFADTGADFKGGSLRHRMLLHAQPCEDLPFGTCSGFQGLYFTWLLGNGTLGNQSNVKGDVIATPILLNFNGDGVTDAVWLEPLLGSDYESRLFAIAGTGRQTPFDYGSGTDTELTNYNTDEALVLDYDADGKDDILIPKSDSSSQWDVLRSDGTTLEDIDTISLVAPENADAVRIADVDGDGLTDIVWATGGTWHYRLHRGEMPDLVTKITDGLGNYFAPSYRPLTSSVYTKGSGATYPDVDIQAPLYVVDAYDANDPSGGTYTVSYHYSGARINLEGRGFLGFATVQASDNRNNVTVTTDYKQSYPAIGLPKRITTSASGTILSDSTIEYHHKSFGSASSHTDAAFPFVYQRTDAHNGANGEGINQIVTTNTYNSTGQPTKIEIATGPVGSETFQFKKTIDTVYDSASEANGCYGLPDKVTVTQENLAAGTNADRVTHYDNDAVNCRVNSITVRGGEAGDLPLTTTYSYEDGYGNRTKILLTGTDLPAESEPDARLTSITYGSAHDFPATITNALDQTSTLTWNHGLGVKASMKDANGHITAWFYDDFGRKTKEARPDGSYTTWSYDACTSSCPGTGSYVVTVQAKDAAGNLGGHQEIVYNSFGRPVQHRRLVLGGSISIVDIVYDELGRKAQVSEPYFSGGAQYWTKYTYDILGRPIEIEAPRNESDSTSSNRTTYVYDGLTTTITAPQNDDGLVRKKRIVRSVRQKIQMVIDGYGSGDLTTTSTTRYGYTPFGELGSIKDAAGNQTILSYNDRGMKTSIQDPDMGTWTYVYNAAGELTRQTDAKGNEINQIYDALGRLESRTELQPDGTSGTTTWTYDSANGKGLLASVTGPAGFSKSVDYDGLSRPKAITTEIDNYAYTINKTYDGFSRIKTVTYPESAAVTPDTAPVASAGADQDVIRGASVTLDGSGSNDPDGGTLTYIWTQTAGPASMTLSGDRSASASFNATTGGLYTFELRVSDGLKNDVDVVQVTVRPPVPSSITVPSIDDDGSYTVSWASVAGASYELYESTLSDFSREYTVYQGSATSFSGLHARNTYYYRVRACANGVCSAWRTATHPVEVAPTAPGTPSSDPYPSVDGDYIVSWNRSLGKVTAYKLYEATQPDFSDENLIYSDIEPIKGVLGKGNGTWYYRVVACNGLACSPYSGSGSSHVTHPPTVPASIETKPNPSESGDYTVSWGVATGRVTAYKLYEATSSTFSGQEPLYSGTARSRNVYDKGNGYLYYRVKACNETACSGYVSTNEHITHPPGQPSTPYMEVDGRNGADVSTDGDFTVHWSKPTGDVTSYVLQESFNGGSWRTVHSGGGYTWSTYNRGDGSYRYHVKACYYAACGSYSASRSITVLHPPGRPSYIDSDKNTVDSLFEYTVSWGT
ncbi:MAG TPA: toxin TcdB middle/N-terminal domain-containing protein, partial [Candidatus Saccharimonadales bacterium]|nr:toxin TcdB middle/N-terminal domain-containing protein [Candidatus Saccharimonadales bacterium]